MAKFAIGNVRFLAVFVEIIAIGDRDFHAGDGLPPGIDKAADDWLGWGEAQLLLNRLGWQIAVGGLNDVELAVFIQKFGIDEQKPHAEPGESAPRCFAKDLKGRLFVLTLLLRRVI